jgi:hypothetical protein
MRIKHWWYTAPLRLRSILRGRRVERELDEELQFHLEDKLLRRSPHAPSAHHSTRRGSLIDSSELASRPL